MQKCQLKCLLSADCTKLSCVLFRSWCDRQWSAFVLKLGFRYNILYRIVGYCRPRCVILCSHKLTKQCETSLWRDQTGGNWSNWLNAGPGGQFCWWRKPRFNLPKGQAEAVVRRRICNRMTKRKEKKDKQ